MWNKVYVMQWTFGKPPSPALFTWFIISLYLGGCGFKNGRKLTNQRNYVFQKSIGFNAYMLSACQFFQKRSVARGPRTGLFSSQIESNEFSEL